MCWPSPTAGNAIVEAPAALGEACEEVVAAQETFFEDDPLEALQHAVVAMRALRVVADAAAARALRQGIDPDVVAAVLEAPGS